MWLTREQSHCGKGTGPQARLSYVRSRFQMRVPQPLCSVGCMPPLRPSFFAIRSPSLKVVAGLPLLKVQVRVADRQPVAPTLERSGMPKGQAMGWPRRAGTAGRCMVQSAPARGKHPAQGSVQASGPALGAVLVWQQGQGVPPRRLALRGQPPERRASMASLEGSTPRVGPAWAKAFAMGTGHPLPALSDHRMANRCVQVTRTYWLRCLPWRSLQYGRSLVDGGCRDQRQSACEQAGRSRTNENSWNCFTRFSW